MAAVAVRRSSLQSKTDSSRAKSGAKARPRRKPRTVARKFVRAVVLVVVMACLFCYVNLYANLAETSTSRSKLLDLRRQEKIKNERLKLELTVCSSPQGIVAAAQRQKMVYATEYEYLERPRAVASAVDDQ